MGRWISTIAVAALAVGGCASDPAPAQTAGTTAPSSPCVLEQSPVVLPDGTELYVEPQTLLRLGESWVVAGSPSFHWSVEPGRDAIAISRYEHVAVSLGRPARAIPKPIPGRIASVISTALENGRWAAIFDEIHPDSVPMPTPRPTAYWYGEHDGTTWSVLEPLPIPAGSRLELRESSGLVRAGDSLIWLALEREAVGRLVIHRYERSGGQWRHARLPNEAVELVVLEHDATSGTWMLLAGPDPELSGQKTLRLYREGPPRVLVSRVVAVTGDDAEIWWPALEVRGDTATVSWVLMGREGSPAFARIAIAPGSPGSVVDLDDNVLHLYSMTRSDRSLAWVAEHVDPDTGSKELRLLRLDGSHVVRGATAPSPFTGFFRAEPNGLDEVLLVGPQMGLVPPETPVRSLILRLSASC